MFAYDSVYDRLFENEEFVEEVVIDPTYTDSLDELEDEIEKFWKNNDVGTGEDIIISNMRHKNLILEALDSANKSLEALEFDLPVDIISIDIKSLLESLGTITGQNVSEETINGIFSRFCLGK